MLSWLRKTMLTWLGGVPVEGLPGKGSATAPAPAPEAADGLFAPEEVMTFQHAVSYTVDGKTIQWKFVLKDPVELYRRMMKRGTEISNAIKVAYSPSKFADGSRSRLCELIREVFEIPGPEMGGLSETHLGELLTQFINYSQTIKKKLPPLTLTPAVTSATTTPSVGEEVGNPPDTKSTSDSGSTVVESSSEQPVPTPSVQESPQVKSSLGWSTTVP